MTLTIFYYFIFSHRNVSVRKTTAQFLSLLAERMGASRLLSGAKDVTEKILPTAAQFVTDGGSETRHVYTCVDNRYTRYSEECALPLPLDKVFNNF